MVKAAGREAKLDDERTKDADPAFLALSGANRLDPKAAIVPATTQD